MDATTSAIVAAQTAVGRSLAVGEPKVREALVVAYADGMAVVEFGTDEGEPAPPMQAVSGHLLAGDRVRVLLVRGQQPVVLGRVDVPEWVDLAYGTGWSNAGVVEAGGAQAYRDQAGVVRLRGAVAGPGVTPAQDSLMVTVPAGYRPGRLAGFAVWTIGGAGLVRVFPDGRVLYWSGAGTVMTLDGISYLAEA